MSFKELEITFIDTKTKKEHTIIDKLNKENTISILNALNKDNKPFSDSEIKSMVDKVKNSYIFVDYGDEFFIATKQNKKELYDIVFIFEEMYFVYQETRRTEWDTNIDNLTYKQLLEYCYYYFPYIITNIKIIK